jgi:hypothetical protein
MAGYDPKKAALFNELIQNGLSEDAALAQAGITDPSSYVIDEVGTPETNRNYGQLTDAGFNVPGRTGNTLSAAESESDPDDDRQFRTTVTNVQTTSDDTTTVTGGGSRTTVVQPTQFQDTAASRTAQSEADRVAAEKSALSARLKSEGKSGAEVLRDPRYRELSAQQQSLQNQADAAKTPVPGTGSVTTTTTNASGDITDVQTSTPDFVTANAGISDPTAQISEVGAVNPVAGPALTDAVTNNTPDPFEVDGAGIGLTDEEVFAQDNPITSVDTEDTFAGPGYGFEYDEDGELIPAADPFRPDVFDADEITPDSDPALDTGRFATATPDDIAPVRSLPEAPVGNDFVFDDDGNLIPADSVDAQDIVADQSRVENSAAAPVGGTFVEVFDEDSGTWGVVDADTGETVASGLTEQQAILEAENRSAGDPSYGSPAAEPAPNNEQDTEGGVAEGTVAEIKARQSIREQLGLGANGANRGDWRVRLSLAPGSNYLYNSTDPGILRPLASTQGVIFPYTPTISTTYSANYEQYDLTHSNFRGYFYRNSNVGEVSVTATFTAQDTREAEYLLAVIHFFRSATKMFYGGGNGQPDEYLGSPPPLVYLTGYGDYQFSGHPCVISQFTYNLPSDVDYIRAFSKNINGTSMANRADQQSISPTVPSLGTAVLSRLTAIGLGAPGSGGQSSRKPSSPSDFRPGDLGLGGGADNPTYVPTKIDISLTLLPMQSRQRISQEFSLRDFATGKLLRGGMW